MTGDADRGTEAGAERQGPAVDENDELPTTPLVGFYSGQPGQLGAWVVQVRGGSAFALNAVAALSQVIAARPPGPSRDVFERIREAFIEASPDYGESS